MWKEKGQLRFCAFPLDPDFQTLIFTCISWRNTSPVPCRYNKNWGGAFAFGWKVWGCHGSETKKKGLGSKQSMSHFAKGEKKDYSFLCPGLVGRLGAQIELMNNLRGHWLFFRVKSYRKVWKTKGHASHLPALQHYRPHFQSCFITYFKGKLGHIDISTPNSYSQPAHIEFAVFDKALSVFKIYFVRNLYGRAQFKFWFLLTISHLNTVHFNIHCEPMSLTTVYPMQFLACWVRGNQCLLLKSQVLTIVICYPIVQVWNRPTEADC